MAHAPQQCRPSGIRQGYAGLVFKPHPAVGQAAEPQLLYHPPSPVGQWLVFGLLHRGYAQHVEVRAQAPALHCGHLLRSFGAHLLQQPVEDVEHVGAPRCEVPRDAGFALCVAVGAGLGVRHLVHLSQQWVVYCKVFLLQSFCKQQPLDQPPC